MDRVETGWTKPWAGDVGGTPATEIATLPSLGSWVRIQLQPESQVIGSFWFLASLASDYCRSTDGLPVSDTCAPPWLPQRRLTLPASTGITDPVT